MSTTKQSTGLFPKAVLASIGAAAATLDWTRTFVARAIERGEMAEMEAQEASQYPEAGQPAPASSAAQATKAEPMPGADRPAASRRLPWVANRSDLAELHRQLDRLDEQVTALEQQRASSLSGAASEAP
jgi:polyhydroxyalkanoate synthesis regulator phasin